MERIKLIVCILRDLWRLSYDLAKIRCMQKQEE